MVATPDTLLEALTPEQREVVLHEKGPLLVIAGPGAGKTEVMLRRAAYLVCERGVEPEALLLTTFTRKAAEELRLRLARFLGRDVERVFISTIHGFCQWVLENYPQVHPYGRYFQVLDEDAQYLLILSHLENLGLGRGKGRVGDHVEAAIAAFNAYSEECVDPARLLEVLRASGAGDEEIAMAEAYRRYLALLVAERAIDFGGLQREAYRVLREDAAVREAVQRRFRYLIVDEHQDTNPIQDRILGLVAAPEYNLCVVGDDDQSIYRFRGATVRNFLDVPATYPNTRTIVLSRNFRSTAPIVELTGRLIAHNPVRYRKALVAHRGTGPEILLLTAEDVDDEGERLADLIDDLRRSQVIRGWRNVAVLFTSVRYFAGPLLAALAKRRIPCEVTGDGGFFDRPDVRQLKDLVIALGWPSYWRTTMLHGPVLGLAPETLTILEQYEGNLWELDEAGMYTLGIVDERDRRVLAQMIALHRRVQAKEYASITGLVHEILAITGYLANRLRAGDDAAVLNVAQFTRLATNFDRHGRSRSTFHFGEYLWSLPERSLDERRPPLDDAVQVMTIHQSKGLEFPVVIVPSVVEGRLPKHARHGTVTYRVPDELAPLVMPPEIATRRQPAEDDPHLADQRRLFYVAMTRARDLVILSVPERIRKQRCKPSRFLAEMGLELKELPIPSYRIDGSERRALGTPRAHLTFSAINAYLTCPLRYRLLYEDGLSVPTWYFVQFGTSLHRTLEAIHRRALAGEPVDEPAALALFEQCWVPFGPRSVEAEQRLEETGRGYIARYVREHAASFPRVRRAELTFSYDAGDALLSGRVDLVREAEGGGLEIVDFKTRAHGGLEITNARLQVELYALACENLLDDEVRRLTVHLLADGETLDFPWDPQARQHVRDTLDEVITGIAERQFAPKPGPHCRACDFRRLCPYGDRAAPARPAEA
uniref:DNA 3'-5' helicase n=1 Tax=Thermorudis peleae TaxID=1382356 RepID=A0A831TET7_9BACT